MRNDARERHVRLQDREHPADARRRKAPRLDGGVENVPQTSPPGRPADRRGLDLLDDQLPAIMWTTDADLLVTWAGGAGLRTLDVAPSHVVGHGFFECFQSDELRSPGVVAHRRALRGERASFDVEWVGSAYQAQVGPMRDPDGAIVGVIGIALDVSERHNGNGNTPLPS